MKKKYLIILIAVIFFISYSFYTLALLGGGDSYMWNALIQLTHERKSLGTNDIYHLLDHTDYSHMSEPPISYRTANFLVLRLTPFMTMYVSQEEVDDETLFVKLIRQPYPFFPFKVIESNFTYNLRTRETVWDPPKKSGKQNTPRPFSAAKSGQTGEDAWE